MPKTEVDVAMISRWIGIAFGIVTIIVLMMYFMSGFGEISSQAYQYARSLYTVCNQKDAQRLDKVVTMIETDHKAQKLSDRDFKYLMGLVQMAQDGKWNETQQKIQSLLEAQVKKQ